MMQIHTYFAGLESTGGLLGGIRESLAFKDGIHIDEGCSEEYQSKLSINDN
jgi:hypothetical protein